MKYEVGDQVFYEIDDVLDYCIDEEYYRDDDYFEEWVNNRYSSTVINGVTYYPFDIIDNVSDGNYSDLLDEFCELRNEDDRDTAERELTEAEDGDVVNVQNYTVIVRAEEDIDNTKSMQIIEECRRKIQYTMSSEEKAEEEAFMSLFRQEA